MMRNKVLRKCSCCGRSGEIGLFEPLADYYQEMRKKYHAIEGVTEFLNEEEYTCKYCFTSDRGRMICAFLCMAKLPYAKKGTRILQIAPERGIEEWILRNCPNVLYESTDLYDDSVSFRSDIQDMTCVLDKTYDYFICSHVLEHVFDDEKAIRELARILKDDGIGIFLVPVCLDIEDIDEEWGLSEAENWRRFGQNDHCRLYSKKGLIERLKRNGFYVHLFDKSIFGEKIFEENAFTETSTLYILSKTENSTESLLKKLEQKKCYEDYRYGQKLLFSACSMKNNELFSITNIEQIPIKINLKNKAITFIDKFDKNGLINSEDMIVDIHSIYLLELNGHRMMKYCLDGKRCQYYEINCHVKDWGNFAAYALYKRNIYIFPKYTTGIVKVNLDKEEVVVNYKYYSDILNNNSMVEDEESYFEYGFQENNILWVFQKNGNPVVAYDMERDTWNVYVLPIKIEYCVHVVLKQDVFYILSLEGKIYSWNIKDNSMKLVVDCSLITEGENSFGRIAVTDKLIFLLPALSDTIYRFNIQTKEIDIFNDYPDTFQYIEPEGWSKYKGYCEDKENYYFAMRSSVYILCINKENGEVKWISPKISSADYFNMYAKYMSEVLCEDTWDLKNLIYSSTDLYTENGNNKIINGEKIWEKLNE